LTFEQFKVFAIQTDYLRGKGKTVNSYSIDRIKNEEGYSIGNIQVLTLSENSKKHTKKIEYDHETRTFYTATVGYNPSVSDEEDAPF
jgi:hypothetical protein